MNDQRYASQQVGFTLIETLVYLALYVIIIGGGLTCVYSLFESSARNETAAMVEEEGDYLAGKIDSALSNATSVIAPLTSGTTLIVSYADASTLTIMKSGTHIALQRNSTAVSVLNNSHVSITTLAFTHVIPKSDGVNPESVSVVFTLSATTSDGHVLSRDFSTLRYLRI